MIFVQVVFTIALLIVSSVSPGLFFIRYLRWRPLETLCGFGRDFRSYCCILPR